MSRAAWLAAALGLACAMPACAQTFSVTLHPVKDNSMYSEGDASNALGNLFSGETANGPVRRALLQFDPLAGGIPAGATITSVSLTLTLIKAGPQAIASTFELRPLLDGWGEGTSVASPPGGTGGAPTTGDATWNYRFYPGTPWATPGGDAGSVSGTATIGTAANSAYTFVSQAGMISDAQSWLDHPATNFGWLLRVANESPGIVSAREFDSRETPLATQPALTILYTVIPEPGAAALLLAGALAFGKSRRFARSLPR